MMFGVAAETSLSCCPLVERAYSVVRSAALKFEGGRQGVHHQLLSINVSFLADENRADVVLQIRYVAVQIADNIEFGRVAAF